MNTRRADELEAFKPFDDLALLMTRPAHLATFLHYLLSNGFVEEQMVSDCYHPDNMTATLVLWTVALT